MPAAHSSAFKAARRSLNPNCSMVVILDGCSQVLSVQTALSIQSHPDKELAARLHKERPNVRGFAN